MQVLPGPANPVVPRDGADVLDADQARLPLAFRVEGSNPSLQVPPVPGVDGPHERSDVVISHRGIIPRAALEGPERAAGPGCVPRPPRGGPRRCPAAAPGGRGPTCGAGPGPA